MDGVTTLPRGDGLTVADLDRIGREDGLRYELLDGVIVVNAAPNDRHQGIVTRLILLLSAACPPALRIRPAPYDVRLSEFTQIQPDVIVAALAHIDPTGGLDGPPVLAIEILSPSSRPDDLGRKKDLLERAGCPSYWVVDPGHEGAATTLTAWELSEGTYIEVARITGRETWVATRPFPVRVVPEELLDD